MSDDNRPTQLANSSLSGAAGSDPTQASDAAAQSRRRFLRTAIYSGVAIVSVSTSAGVVEACYQNPGIITTFHNHFGGASGPTTCTMCFEDSEFQSTSTFNVHDGHASPPEFFIWFTAHDLQPGNYTMSISPDPTSTSSPFKLATSGNNAFLIQSDAGKAKDCPRSNPSSQVRQNHSPDGLFSSAYAISGSSHDLQLKVHVKWDGTHISSNHTYTFTGTIRDSHDAVVCTASVQVTAKKA